MLLEKRKLRRYSGHPFLKQQWTFLSNNMCIWNPGGGLFWPTFIYKNKSFKGVSNLEDVVKIWIFVFPCKQLSHQNWKCKNNSYTFLNLRHLYVNHFEGFTNIQKIGPRKFVSTFLIVNKLSWNISHFAPQ